MVTSAYPMVTVILGVAILGEQLTRLQWLGVGMVLVGIVLLLAETNSDVSLR